MRDYFEPWSAEPARAEGSPDWIVWGTDMMTPCVVDTIAGEPVVIDGRRIVTRFGPPVTDRGTAAAAPGRLARRMAACVNALGGVKAPEKAVSEAQALLADLARGVVVDPWRVARCAALLCPADTGTTETGPWPEVIM